MKNIANEILRIAKDKLDLDNNPITSEDVNTLEDIVTTKILDTRFITKDMAYEFCKDLKESLKEGLGDFSKIYDRLIRDANMCLGYKSPEGKVYRKVIKLLLATASNEEIASYSKESSRSHRFLIEEREKFQNELLTKKRKRR